MKSKIPLLEMTDQVYIVAHKEDTSNLETVLSDQGFHVHVQRGPYSAKEQTYSSAMKCLVNHANVWRQVAGSNRPVMVVEADFVPVKKLAERMSPLPFDPLDKSIGFAWLYSAGSTLYGFDQHGFPHGHGNTTVAYLLTPEVAAMLLDFFKREESKVSAGSYTKWETYLGVYLRKERGILNYIPVYCYGEHGGLPQPEHAKQGIRAWHQADILLDTLEFLPIYADGKRWRYVFFRWRSIIRGWVRLFLLRFYDPRYINGDSKKGRVAMAWFSFIRLCKIY